MRILIVVFSAFVLIGCSSSDPIGVQNTIQIDYEGYKVVVDSIPPILPDTTNE